MRKGEPMFSKEDVLAYVEEENVRFIRLTFFDLLGRQKNVSILPNRLPQAFEHGVAIDASMVTGFQDLPFQDLFLYPDARTMTSLPWRSSNGEVIFMICDICYPDGTPCILDTR